MAACEACGTTRPEFIFDVLETPLRDLSGDIILEENNRGQLVPARRYSPDYWRDKYEAFRLMKDVQIAGYAARSAASPASERQAARTPALARGMETIPCSLQARVLQQDAQ